MTAERRVVMRRARSFEPILNSLVDPRIVVRPSATNADTWVWASHDFADGTDIVERVFALKCPSPAAAKAVKEVSLVTSRRCQIIYN